MTQCERILRHMQDYGGITQAEAFTEYGISRLGARIYDLKAAGARIKSETVTGRNRYGEPISFSRYSLADENPEVIIGPTPAAGCMWEAPEE